MVQNSLDMVRLPEKVLGSRFNKRHPGILNMSRLILWLCVLNFWNCSIFNQIYNLLITTCRSWCILSYFFAGLPHLVSV